MILLVAIFCLPAEALAKAGAQVLEKLAANS